MASSLKDSQNFFIPSLNDDVRGIEKPDGYVHLLLLCMSLKDYFYIHQSLLLNIQDLLK